MCCLLKNTDLVSVLYTNHNKCQHSYSLLWPHNPTMCDSALELKQKVRAAFGYKTMQYNSLIHVWRDWYSDYFEERRYPLLMIRLEDVIYRPKQVVEKVCECVGGTFIKANFIVHDEVANIGKGHGKHRSNLIDTFIKHGKPLKSYHQKFHAKDWKIIRKVLQKDYGMLEAFNYQLFH